MKARPKRNIVGPMVRALRNHLGWTQDQAAAHCNIEGFDISRATYAQIESQLRNVTDIELALLAKAFRVKVEKLIPEELPDWEGKGRKDVWKGREDRDPSDLES
ncbi:MAG: helix-turn-helix transcriptional regulator [Verrucomicrobia bacterium]|jgi:transcriptional regulator with XRE-family HTH domain|nr:helix-turn-helix transcriptional regulator [Verrucomicrobiota bacterium]